MPQIKRITDEPDINELLFGQNFAIDPGVLSRPDHQSRANDRQQCPPAGVIPFGGIMKIPTRIISIPIADAALSRRAFASKRAVQPNLTESYASNVPARNSQNRVSGRKNANDGL